MSELSADGARTASDFNEFESLSDDALGQEIMFGLYGTRFVEYLTIRRFDEYDGMPEVFAAHLQTAMQQLWDPTGTLRNSSRPRQSQGR